MRSSDRSACRPGNQLKAACPRWPSQSARAGSARPRPQKRCSVYLEYQTYASLLFVNAEPFKMLRAGFDGGDGSIEESTSNHESAEDADAHADCQGEGEAFHNGCPKGRA